MGQIQKEITSKIPLPKLMKTKNFLYSIERLGERMKKNNDGEIAESMVWSGNIKKMKALKQGCFLHLDLGNFTF